MNSGLNYYGYRYYDPYLQRWLNRDPIAELGGINLYQAMGNNPIEFVDTDGLALYPPNFVGPLQSQDLRIPYPDGVPGGPWTWSPSGIDPNKGTWIGPKPPKGPRTECKYVPEGSANNNENPYWKVTDPNKPAAGGGNTQRYNMENGPISPEEAHPGANPEESVGSGGPLGPEETVEPEGGETMGPESPTGLGGVGTGGKWWTDE